MKFEYPELLNRISPIAESQYKKYRAEMQEKVNEISKKKKTVVLLWIAASILVAFLLTAAICLVLKISAWYGIAMIGVVLTAAALAIGILAGTQRKAEYCGKISGLNQEYKLKKNAYRDSKLLFAVLYAAKKEQDIEVLMFSMGGGSVMVNYRKPGDAKIHHVETTYEPLSDDAGENISGDVLAFYDDRIEGHSAQDYEDENIGTRDLEFKA